MLEHGRKIATILAADVVGYSRLMSVDDEGTLTALNDRRAIFDRLVQEFDGREFGSVGDSLMAEFRSAVNAVRCAQAIQQAVNRENELLAADRRMALRIGVNLGDVIEDNAALFGDGVNVAARLQALAAPDGILISRAVYEQVKSRVPAIFNAAGVRHVKNIPDAIATYEVLELGARRRLDWRRSPRWLRRALAITLAALSAGAIWWASDSNIASTWPTTIDRVRAPSEAAKSSAPAKAAAPSSTRPPFSPPAHSIAVLPFINMSGDASQDYFSDGLSEELLNSLVRLQALRVTARTSSFSFKGKDVDIPTIARKLNVGAVLEGSVRKSANKVRITAQLINGVNGFHLWSETYDRDLKDVLVLQTEIATAVMTSLEVTLLGDLVKTIELGGTTNPQAFDAYLRSQRLGFGTGDEKNDRASLAALDQAIALDPTYALAHSQRSEALLRNTNYEGTNRKAQLATIAQARTAAERAVEIAPTLGRAHATLALNLVIGSLDFTAAEAAYAKALALEPGNARVQRSYAQFSANLGRFSRAIEALNRAMELDPLNPNSLGNYGRTLHFARRYAESATFFEHALTLEPHDMVWRYYSAMNYLALGQIDTAVEQCTANGDFPYNPVCLAIAYHKQNRKADAAAELAKYRKWAGDGGAFQYAQIYAQWGEREQALHWLAAAYGVRDGSISEIKVDPFLDPIRNTPRYKEIEGRLHFPP